MSGPKFRVLTTILQYGTVQHSAVYDVKSSAHCILSVWSSEVQEQLDNNNKKGQSHRHSFLYSGNRNTLLPSYAFRTRKKRITVSIPRYYTAHYCYYCNLRYFTTKEACCCCFYYYYYKLY